MRCEHKTIGKIEHVYIPENMDHKTGLTLNVLIEEILNRFGNGKLISVRSNDGLELKVRGYFWEMILDVIEEVDSCEFGIEFKHNDKTVWFGIAYGEGFECIYDCTIGIAEEICDAVQARLESIN